MVNIFKHQHLPELFFRSFRETTALGEHRRVLQSSSTYLSTQSFGIRNVRLIINEPETANINASG